MVDLTAHHEDLHEDSMLGLPTFLSFLRGFPDAQRVVEALLFGPLLRFRARAAAMWIVDGSVLKVVANHGHEPGELMRWATVDIELPAPASTCLRTNTIQVYARESLLAGWAEAIQVPLESERIDALFFGFQRSIDDGGGDVVCIPIAVNGAAIGVLGFMVNEHREWQPVDLSILGAVGSALGLWLDSPHTARPMPLAFSEDPTYIAMALTGRQKEILQLVEVGRSNAFIATKLGYSTSTIKQEMQRIMISLDVTSRTDAAKRARAIGLIGS